MVIHPPLRSKRGVFWSVEPVTLLRHILRFKAFIEQDMINIPLLFKNPYTGNIWLFRHLAWVVNIMHEYALSLDLPRVSLKYRTTHNALFCDLRLFIRPVCIYTIADKSV